ncbi:hypothetical protein C0991_010413 [Blastosporella zonata]|nr:hypothetical protein C0991_010413 [Blastosporella zonata]
MLEEIRKPPLPGRERQSIPTDSTATESLFTPLQEQHKSPLLEGMPTRRQAPEFYHTGTSTAPEPQHKSRLLEQLPQPLNVIINEAPEPLQEQHKPPLPEQPPRHLTEIVDEEPVHLQAQHKPGQSSGQIHENHNQDPAPGSPQEQHKPSPPVEPPRRLLPPIPELQSEQRKTVVPGHRHKLTKHEDNTARLEEQRPGSSTVTQVEGDGEPQASEADAREQREVAGPSRRMLVITTAESQWPLFQNQNRETQRGGSLSNIQEQREQGLVHVAPSGHAVEQAPASPPISGPIQDHTQPAHVVNARSASSHGQPVVSPIIHPHSALSLESPHSTRTRWWPRPLSSRRIQPALGRSCSMILINRSLFDENILVEPFMLQRPGANQEPSPRTPHDHPHIDSIITESPSSLASGGAHSGDVLEERTSPGDGGVRQMLQNAHRRLAVLENDRVVTVVREQDRDDGMPPPPYRLDF